MNSQIHLLSTEDLPLAFMLLKDLRPHLTLEKFIEIYHLAHANDHFRFAGIKMGKEWTALMGFRILYDMVHGKHLYIDDLVTLPQHRSQGLGALLLEYAEAEAHRQNCSYLRLCTGVDNHGARRFYEKHQWETKVIVYKKKFTT